MAFETVKSARLPRRSNTQPSAFLYTRESRRVPDQVETRLRLSPPLLKELGWEQNQQLDVMVGTDEDEGKILVAPNASGVFRLRPIGGGCTSYVIASRTIPVPPGINKQVKTSVENGRLLIDFA